MTGSINYAFNVIDGANKAATATKGHDMVYPYTNPQSIQWDEDTAECKLSNNVSLILSQYTVPRAQCPERRSDCLC
jgi:hypothetical protein